MDKQGGFLSELKSLLINLSIINQWGLLVVMSYQLTDSEGSLGPDIIEGL